MSGVFRCFCIKDVISNNHPKLYLQSCTRVMLRQIYSQRPSSWPPPGPSAWPSQQHTHMVLWKVSCREFLWTRMVPLQTVSPNIQEITKNLWHNHYHYTILIAVNLFSQLSSSEFLNLRRGHHVGLLNMLSGLSLISKTDTVYLNKSFKMKTILVLIIYMYIVHTLY